MRRSWASIVLLPLTAPAALLGVIYFTAARRHPPPALLMVFGISVCLLMAVAIVVFIARTEQISG